MQYKVKFQPEVVIYHDRCMDGFTAAYAVWSKFRDKAKNILFIPASHALGKNNLDYWKALVQGKKVVILDFSFERGALLEIKESAEELVVLDHHKSAEEKLGDLDFCYFNQNMSGALITWHAFSGKALEAPNLYKYVSDRDLWKWELAFSKEINAYINVQDKTFESWDILRARLEQRDLSNTVVHGQHILQCLNMLATSMASKAEVWNINGNKVVAVNASELQSEICSILLEHPESNGVSGCYNIEKGKMVWSLRSVGKIDVSKIAGPFGGGGHFNAAGFSISIVGKRANIMYGVRSITSG